MGSVKHASAKRKGDTEAFAWFAYYNEDMRQGLAVSLPLGLLVARSARQRKKAVAEAEAALLELVQDYVDASKQGKRQPDDLLRPVPFDACLGHLAGFVAAIQRDQDHSKGLWDCGFSPSRLGRAA